MAVTLLPEQRVVGPYVKEGTTQFTTLTTTASDPTNKNSIVMSTGRCLVLFENSDGANPGWVTVEASDDAYGRTTGITQQDIPASGWGAFIFEPHGWEGSLGGRNLTVDTEASTIKILAIPL